MSNILQKEREKINFSVTQREHGFRRFGCCLKSIHKRSREREIRAMNNAKNEQQVIDF